MLFRFGESVSVGSFEKTLTIWNAKRISIYCLKPWLSICYLFRCSGSCSIFCGRSDYLCVPNKAKELKVKAFDTTQNNC